MTDYDNTNRGSIWKNEKKQTETHPDFTGTLNVNGVEHWVSAWLRKPDAKPKAPALSFSIRPKEERQPAHETQKPSGPTYPEESNGGGFDDDIPF